MLYSVRNSYPGGIPPIDEATSISTGKHIGSIGRKARFKGQDNIQEARPAAANTCITDIMRRSAWISLWNGSTVAHGEFMLQVITYYTQSVCFP